MENKFNSLFDYNLEKNSDYYGVDNTDDVLGLTKLVLNFDRNYLIENKIINARNYPERPYQLYLDGRPCSTGLNSVHNANKFCDSSGWPTKVENIRTKLPINSNVFVSSPNNLKQPAPNPMKIDSNLVNKSKSN